MRRISLFLLTFLWVSLAFAIPFNQIVFFGDSLTDDGNFYHLTNGLVPQSPPYYEGRFSNGLTWAEDVAEYYAINFSATSLNYAVGGATAVLQHWINDHNLPPILLEAEIYAYLNDNSTVDKSQVLFVIWIGANDYLNETNTQKIDRVTSKVVNKSMWVINTLINNGAKNFLIINLPNLSLTPYARLNNKVELLAGFSQMHNQKLSAAIEDARSKHPAATIFYFDTFTLFNDILDNTEKYNTQYNLNISNTSDACLSNNPRVYDSPTANVANIMGQQFNQSNEPCEQPDQFLFWDQVHPTRIIHQLLALKVIELLG